MTITVAPAGAATVVFTRVGASTAAPLRGAARAAAGSITSTGGTINVSPGTYIWTATPKPGFTLLTARTGRFTATGCTRVLGVKKVQELVATGAQVMVLFIAGIAIVLVGLMLLVGGFANRASAEVLLASVNRRR